MKPVVVHRAKPRENHRAALVALGQAGVAEKSLEVKRLALDEKIGLGGYVGEREVPSVCREHHRVGGGVDRPCAWIEFALEKLVERIVVVHRLGELPLVQAVLLDERLDFQAAGQGIHPAAVPCGDDPPADEQPLGEPAKRIAVRPAQRSLAVNGLGLQRAIPAIDVSDLPVGQLLLDAHAPAGYPPPARLKRNEQ